MKDIKFNTSNKSTVGTSLCGYVETSYSKLVELFGEPKDEETDDYKISTIWVVENKEGRVLDIYDWKMTVLYDHDGYEIDEFRELPVYNWHIGGNSKIDADALRDFILSQQPRPKH